MYVPIYRLGCTCRLTRTHSDLSTYAYLALQVVVLRVEQLLAAASSTFLTSPTSRVQVRILCICQSMCVRECVTVLCVRVRACARARVCVCVEVWGCVCGTVCECHPGPAVGSGLLHLPCLAYERGAGCCRVPVFVCQSWCKLRPTACAHHQSTKQLPVHQKSPVQKHERHLTSTSPVHPVLRPDCCPA